MNREYGGRRPFIPPSENWGLSIGFDKNGQPIELPKVASIFKNHQEEPEVQGNLARACILRSLREGNASADAVISLITIDDVKNEIKIWCVGSNIKLKDEDESEENKYRKAKNLLTPDEELIERLSPHLKQMDLAKLLAVRRYRQADEATRQTLIYGTYHLLGDILGPRRRYHYGQEQVVTPINLPDLPTEIFTEEITRNILLESEIEAALPIFQKSIDEGFRYLQKRRSTLTEPILQDFVSDVEREYQQGLSLNVPGFKNKIAGSQKDIPDSEEIMCSDYPAPHQKLYAQRFIHKPQAIGHVDLLVGDPRTMKTGAFIYAMKAVGAKTPLVVCPASLRYNCEREIREKFQNPVEVIQIKSEREFKRLANGDFKKADYVILSYSLLSRFSSLEFQHLFSLLRDKLGIDALVADEAHLAKEPKSECTKQLYLLSRLLPESAPRIAASATFVVNTVEDLDEPVRMLLPYKYPNPGDFTRAARNDPHLVSALLYGSRLITRWTKEAILGDRLPPVEGGGPREEPVPFSPFHQFIYDLVHQDSIIEDRLKRGMLRQVSLDPLLIRHHYHPESIRRIILELRDRYSREKDERKQEILEDKIKALEERITMVTNLFSQGEAKNALIDAHEKFIHWKITQNIDENFDEDFLVKIGYGKLAAWAFFNLPKGIKVLADETNNEFLKSDWVGLDGIYSSKYRRLKQILDQKIASGEEKVIVFSGFYQTNVTTGIEDLENLKQDEELAFLSLYDQLRQWYGDNCVLKIDGSVSIEPKKGEIAAREHVRKTFRLDPSRKILLATVRSSRLGIDLTIPPTTANQHFKKLVEIWLDLPDTQADFVQGNGRGQGPGQLIPLEIIKIMSTNAEQPNTVRYGFIDHGIAQAVEYKNLIALMAIDGIPLTDEQEAFVKSYMTNLRIDDYPQTPRNYLRERFFVDIRGKGTKRNLEYLEEVGFEGLTNEDFFVTYYSQNDEMSLSGHNAKAVSEIFKKYKEINTKGRLRIGSIGSGVGILQAILGEPLINIDMIMGMLQFSRFRLGDKGEFVRADAARLPFADETFDAVDSSMVLHWTDNSPLLQAPEYSPFHNWVGQISERAIVLQELNRIVARNGLLTITVPSTYLTAEQFGVWKECLEKYFGLRVRGDLPSGLLQATDYRSEPISWIFNLEKIAAPQNGFSLRDLRFNFEQVVSIIANGRRNGNAVISPPYPIPHSEFEIIHPESGKKERLSYKKTVSTVDIEEELLGKKQKLSQEDILSQLGIEEFGFYRRLRKEAKSRWNLSQKEADELAVEVVFEWAKNSTQKHDVKRILTELDIIMEEIYHKK